MQTNVYTTKTLEKFFRKLMKKDQEGHGEAESILGDWNANLFYVDR